MSVRGDSQVSAVLQAAQSGDRQAASDLLPLVYAELHELARARLARQPPGQTLTPTALVNEVYLRVAGDRNVTWEGRQHFFFFAAARAMRDILVEQARRKAGPKQGGGQRRRTGRGVRRPRAPLGRCAGGPRGTGGTRSARPAQGPDRTLALLHRLDDGRNRGDPRAGRAHARPALALP
jgi:hypothetical protein